MALNSYLEGTRDDSLTSNDTSQNGKNQTRPQHSRGYSQIERVLPCARYFADVGSLSDILAKLSESATIKPQRGLINWETNPKQKARVREAAPRNSNGPRSLLVWQILRQGRVDTPSAESTHVGKQGLHSGESQKNTTKGHPTLVAISDQVGTGEIWRESLENRRIVVCQILQSLVRTL